MDQLVLPRGDGWMVKGAENRRATKVFPDAVRALEYAKQIARGQRSVVRTVTPDCKPIVAWDFREDGVSG